MIILPYWGTTENKLRKVKKSWQILELYQRIKRKEAVECEGAGYTNCGCYFFFK